MLDWTPTHYPRTLLVYSVRQLRSNEIPKDSQ